MIITNSPAQARQEQHKKGFTLTEIAIVLGIMGLVLGAIWVAAASVYNNQRINQGNTAIMQVLQGVRTLYGQQATIGPVGAASDMTAQMIQAGVVPTNLINVLAMRSPWGQPMFVGNTAANTSVVITVNGMTTALCVGVVSAIAGAAHDRTLQNTSVVANANAPAVPAVNSGVDLTTAVPPVLGGTIAAGTGTGCTANSSTNSAVFVFGLQG